MMIKFQINVLFIFLVVTLYCQGTWSKQKLKCRERAQGNVGDTLNLKCTQVGKKKAKWMPVDTSPCPSTTTTTTTTTTDSTTTTEETCYEGEEEKGETCNRDCTKYPTETKTCRFTFVLQQLFSDKPGRLADGKNRSVLVYNGQLPGPTIAVCEGDRVVVRLVNKLHGSPAQIGGFNSTTLHLHGIREKQPSGTSGWSRHGGPWSDGVPLVTQCPTPSGDNQTYCFSGINGAPAGTYWYHSHMGRQRMNGAEGKLIIMQRKKDRTRVDVDLPENSLFLQEWYNNTANDIQRSLLINGKGKLGKHCYKQSDDDSVNYDEFISNFKMGKKVSFTKHLCPPLDISTTYEVFNVKEPGQKYRFRIIGGIGDDVPIRVSIEGHKFSVIATDARDVIKSADNFDALWVSAGERYDIVINTKIFFKKQAYKINVYHKHGDILLCTLAWLRYLSQTVPLGYEANCKAMAKEHPTRVLNPVPNKFSEWYNPNYIYPVNLTAVHQAPNIQEVLNTQYITIPVDYNSTGFMFNNFTMPFPKDYPDIPFLFQSPSKNTKRCGVRCVWASTGSTRGTNCFLHVPDTCKPSGPSKYPNIQISKYPNKKCHCQHVIQQPWYDDSSDRQYWFEIILINNQPEGGIAHPIHHHGGWFNILGMGQFNHSIYRDTIMDMDKNCDKKKECLPRNYNYPVFKDVIQVPTNGYVIFRAPIDNRGTWIVHCHINWHVEHGMTMIFQIGEPDGDDGWSMGPDEKTAQKNKNKKCPKVQPQKFG